MKKAAIIVGVALLLLIAVLLGMQGAQRGAAEASAKAAKDVAIVGRGDVVLTVIETGTIDAIRSVDVRSRASGRLARRLVDEGAQVTRGQLIALIDPQEIKFQVSQNEAQLRGARSGAARTMLEIEQRRITANANYEQALARLDQLRQELKIQPTLTRASIQSAESAFNAARQERDRLSQSIHPTQRTAAESELQDAKASFSTAKRDYDRMIELEKMGYVATQALDAASLRLDQARIRQDKAQADLNRLEAQHRLEMETADENMRRARADLDRAMANRIQDDVKRKEYESAMAAADSARAQLKDVEILRRTHEQSLASVSQLQSVLGDSMRQLGETQVRAPMDGVVAKKYVEVGDMVTGLSPFTQGTAIFRIEDRTSLRALLEINEIDVARLKFGMPVKVEIDAFPDTVFSGKVKKIAPSSTAMQPAQPGAGGAPGDAVVKYEVEVWLSRPDARLRSGMSAKCTFETVSQKNVMRLPVEFVGKDKDGRFVMIAPAKGSKDQPKRRAVQVGVTTGAFAEILSGVKEGERIARPKFSGPPRKGFFQAGPDEEQAQDQSGQPK